MASKDRIGGYTLDELLGSKPISNVEKKQTGMVSKIIGAPFRVVIALVKVPFVVAARLLAGIGGAVGEIVKLPMRLVGALLRPWKTKQP